jgi:protein-S-isoprenylcysteine O-methyltransferase Ste14
VRLDLLCAFVTGIRELYQSEYRFMMSTTAQWPIIVLFLACLGSFAWGMECFFVRPAGVNRGMRLISLLGAVFAAVHMATLFLEPVNAARAAVAAPMYVCALGLFWWAITVNRRVPLSAAFSKDPPIRLVQQGPYRLMRHPFYCSYLLTWTAGFVATGAWWLLATVFIMLAIYINAARAEERKFKSSDLAAHYETYRARTGRFLPNPLKFLHMRRTV